MDLLKLGLHYIYRDFFGRVKKHFSVDRCLEKSVYPVKLYIKVYVSIFSTGTFKIIAKFGFVG